jgi:hypothetical protein
MPWVGFEPIIPAFERAKTVHALDQAATVIGTSVKYLNINFLTIMCVYNQFFCSFLRTHTTKIPWYFMTLQKKKYWIPYLWFQPSAMTDVKPPTSGLVIDGSECNGVTVICREKRNILEKPGHHEFHMSSSETFRCIKISKTTSYRSQDESNCVCTENSRKT